ncbi:MAG: hypothetical protein SV375_02395 [Thermodesulfobacteriota bacterium]|nr:hypothetical protein [Thermodesulfobacteriota bacterium]
MKKLFKDILNVEDVKGVMLVSFEGDLIFKDFLSSFVEDPANIDWKGLFIDSMNGIREVDMIYEKFRLYARKTSSGYLLVLMGIYAPIAMVRLNCDILLPSLKKMTPSRGLGRVFRRKK